MEIMCTIIGKEAALRPIMLPDPVNAGSGVAMEARNG